MKASSLSDIKTELKTLSAPGLTELCLRLARFKKENKELLAYLLFEADDVEQYVGRVKEEMDESFADVNTGNAYFAKKSLRKILRIANKHIKYMGHKEAEVSLLLHFCAGIRGLKLYPHKNTALSNLYKSQVRKIEAAISGLHEDLQHDFSAQLERLI
ncbi:MAG: hypothetical protein WKF70_10485 [Chitinophagaceae bacterium]